MRARLLAAFALLIALTALTRSVRAQSTKSDVIVDAQPMIAPATTLPYGWNEILVRVTNNGTKPMKGSVTVESSRFSVDNGKQHVEAPFAVPATSSVNLRVPVLVESYSNVTLRVSDDAGHDVSVQNYTATAPLGVVLLDVSEASRVKPVLNDASITPSYAPTAASRSFSGGGPKLQIVTPRYDPATGDPILPDRAGVYAAADAVLVRSDALAKLSGAELDALAGYVLAGGTLAIAITRPEDARHATIVAFAGGAIASGAASSVATQEIVLPTPPSTGGSTRAPPRAHARGETTTLVGWSGGNLAPSAFGASASYGLGEVHFLAFDPTQKGVVDDPWVQVRMIELARRAFDRRSIQTVRPGADPETGTATKVRQLLDPNESSRWGIAIATLLLCIYAGLAGPLNFSLHAKKGRPLRALIFLPLFSAIAFGVIVGVGIVAKGVVGRARHLTLVEAGAGMSRGSARRYRGFYASRAKELTVRTTDASSLVTLGPTDRGDQNRRVLVDREGVRLVEVAALPWQTIVAREDGFAALGEGISMTEGAGGEITIANRSGRDLRSVIVRTPAGTGRYFARVKDGEKVAISSGSDVAATVDGAQWLAGLGSVAFGGGPAVHRLNAYYLQRFITDTPGLGDAWEAMEDAVGDAQDWIPDGVPVLLAQLDGGEGRTGDSGLAIESDRVLVRIVGWGGKP